MKILLTGGAGFIGSNVAKRLLEQRHEVVVVDNFNNYYPSKFKHQNLELIKHRLLGLYMYDINQPEMKDIFAKYKFDKVIHLAAAAGVRNSLLHPDHYIDTNVKGTTNLLQLMKDYSIKDIIFASSSSVYGNTSGHPILEDTPITMAVSPYAATKSSAEILCYTYHKLFGIRTTILRFFTVYGPSGRPDMAPYILTESLLKKRTFNLYGDGKATRDFTNIKDIVNGIILAMENPFPFETFNLGSSKPISMKEFITLLETISGKKLKMTTSHRSDADVLHTYADIHKAQKLLGFQPSVKLKDGLSEFIEWFKNNRL